MTARGFSLVELLVALTICAVVTASVAIVVPPARAAFERTPAGIELQQRARTTVDVMTQVLRVAGADAVVAEEFGTLSGVVPAVIPYDADNGRFTRLKVIASRAHGAQGVLDQHQAGGHGALSLASPGCPSLEAVCGFMRDTTALIADGSGRFDVFIVADADATTNRLTASRSFSAAYPAGSFVIEADTYMLQLDAQPDGSRSLVRVTAAGAVQPIADRVRDLNFTLYALDDAGELGMLPVSSLTDGPWIGGGPDGMFDEDVFTVKQVDVAITFDAAAPLRLQRSLRFGVFLRNVR
jgi:prepilin-type N-terminal cleavage/methylation domain-containing protein